MPYTLVTDIISSQFEQPLGISLNFQNTQIFETITTINNSAQALNNLKNLLLTKIGERVGLPTYGCDLLYILFEPNLNDIKDDIKQLITDPVQYWLPYIDIIDIVITTNQDNPNLQHEIEIKIIFSVDDRLTQSLNINVNSSGALTTTTENVI
jgi:phage baseplate assembly protein W